MPSVTTRVVCGHVMLQPLGMGGKWVSRAPLERGTAGALTTRMNQEGARYGILVEREIGENNVGSLTIHASLDGIRSQMGADKVGKKFGGTDIAANDDRTVMAFEFAGQGEIGVSSLRHPLVKVTYPQARGLALAMGLDLPTNGDFLEVLKGPTEGSLFTSPDDPEFRKYVHCSIGKKETGTVDIENRRYLDQPHGTRHWLGNVWKWMLRDFAAQHQFAGRGGGWNSGNPDIFAASYRSGGGPDYFYGILGVVCVGGAQDSRPVFPWLF